MARDCFICSKRFVTSFAKKMNPAALVNYWFQLGNRNFIAIFAHPFAAHVAFDQVDIDSFATLVFTFEFIVNIFSGAGLGSI